MITMKPKSIYLCLAFYLTVTQQLHALIINHSLEEMGPADMEINPFVKENFEKSDFNNDGQVTVDEFIKVFITVGVPVDGYLKEGFAIVFRRMDEDSNGVLDLNEFSRFYDKREDEVLPV